MIISQKRIVGTTFLNEYTGKSIRLVVPIDEGIAKNAVNAGFSENLSEGECILPKKHGPVSKINAEGFFERHKEKPKETCYRTVVWTSNRWIGGGDTEDVTDFVEIPYKRYPRTLHLPLSMELRIIKKDGMKYIVSPLLICNEDEFSNIKIGINLFLELFQSCHILLDDFTSLEMKTKIIRLNWEILPKGEYPWEIRYKQIRPFIEKASPGNRPVIAYRLEFLNSFAPDFVAIGVNGFSGYMVYGFSNEQIYIFESTMTNNATYVFDQKWKNISQLTKKEILTNELQKQRIIHRKNTWASEVKTLFN